MADANGDRRAATVRLFCCRLHRGHTACLHIAVSVDSFAHALSCWHGYANAIRPAHRLTFRAVRFRQVLPHFRHYAVRQPVRCDLRSTLTSSPASFVLTKSLCGLFPGCSRISKDFRLRLRACRPYAFASIRLLPYPLSPASLLLMRVAIAPLRARYTKAVPRRLSYVLFAYARWFVAAIPLLGLLLWQRRCCRGRSGLAPRGCPGRCSVRKRLHTFGKQRRLDSFALC